MCADFPAKTASCALAPAKRPACARVALPKRPHVHQRSPEPPHVRRRSSAIAGTAGSREVALKPVSGTRPTLNCHRHSAGQAPAPTRDPCCTPAFPLVSAAFGLQPFYAFRAIPSEKRLSSGKCRFGLTQSLKFLETSFKVVIILGRFQNQDFFPTNVPEIGIIQKNS